MSLTTVSGATTAKKPAKKSAARSEFFFYAYFIASVVLVVALSTRLVLLVAWKTILDMRRFRMKKPTINRKRATKSTSAGTHRTEALL